MKIIDKYLWGSTIQGILMAWIALVILMAFFAFIDEAGKTNALYSTAQAFIYVVYTLPGLFYEMFPTATLIGTLLGLGNLASHSEFVAMRAAGLSVRQIIFSIIKLGALLVVAIFLIGEFLVPATDLHARNFKAHLKSKNIVLIGGAGLWVKEKNSILHIGKVVTNEQLSDISIYTFKDDHSELESLTTSTESNLSNDGWTLKNVKTTTFRETRVNTEKSASLLKTDFIDPQIINVATVDPEQLSSQTLSKLIKHQRNNNLKTDKYELIFWKRYSVPLSALVMLILAMPFLFGSNRGGGAGQRVFIGIVVGIVFSLVSRAANQLGIVYGFSPLMSAFLPALLFLGVGLFALNRIR